MGACSAVKSWITEQVQVPVEQQVTEARRQCDTVKEKIEEQISKPVEEWVAREERKCKEKKCKWWCGCCNKWFCWIETIFVKIVRWIVVTVVKWIVHIVCKIVMVIIDVITKLVLRLVKFLVSFFVCLFTLDFKGLWQSLVDLWNDLIDLLEELVLFVKSLVDDAEEIVDDVQDLTDAVGCSFGRFGMFFVAGPGRWIVRVGREGLDTVYDLIDNVWDIVAGALRLNWCQFVSGWAGLGTDIGKAVALALGIPAGLGGAVRDAINQHDLEETIENAIQRVTDDEDRRERMRDKVRLGYCPFGLPWTVVPYRFYLNSRSQQLDLRALHKEGLINLFGAAGRVSDCDGNLLNRPRGEVVYAGTRSPVSYSDLKRYLAEGPNAVAEFHVFAITERIFLRDLNLAKRKAYSIGIELKWGSLREHEITTRDPELVVPDNDTDIPLLFQKLGRIGVGDNLCELPVAAVFRYRLNPQGKLTRMGYTSVFRPPDTTKMGASGVSFRDRLPEFLFRWVCIHEIGHYFGLDHADHDGLQYIMWTPAEDQHLDWWNGGTTAELFLSGLEPQFTRDDAFRVWNWITGTALACLDESAVVIT
jgi:hypothetical protein